MHKRDKVCCKKTTTTIFVLLINKFMTENDRIYTMIIPFVSVIKMIITIIL